MPFVVVLKNFAQFGAGVDIVGIDLVEVAPDYDLSGSTTILAAQLLMNFLGFIFHAREKK